jgi:hypothetical protein
MARHHFKLNDNSRLQLAVMLANPLSETIPHQLKSSVVTTAKRSTTANTT